MQLRRRGLHFRRNRRNQNKLVSSVAQESSISIGCFGKGPSTFAMIHYDSVLRAVETWLHVLPSTAFERSRPRLPWGGHDVAKDVSLSTVY